MPHQIQNKLTKIKTLALNKSIPVNLAIFAVLLTTATIAPLFHFQPITGPIVNAMLFLAVLLLSTPWALMLCLLPSLIALSVGTLPVVLATMVPFIMVSNAILVISFATFKNKSFFLGVVCGSVLKFIFLFSTSYVVVNLIASQPIAQKASSMMNWPQLITALGGGLIAWAVFKALKK